MIRTIPHDPGASPPTWVDLVAPTAEEVRQIQDRYGVKLPDLDALREIETTSRLRADGETLYMSAPMIVGTAPRPCEIAPTGFILLPETLVTVRYAELEIFDAVATELANEGATEPGLVFVRLLEETVDRAADHLEHAAEIVSTASQAIFAEDVGKRGLSHETKSLRHAILTIGRASERSARVRYMFLSVGRMVNFVLDRCVPKLSDDLTERLQAIGHDISSLDEFELSLSGRIQLLQDAATGLISIAQNDVVKVLTVAVNNITFVKPMFVTDEITAYARVTEIKRTSMVVGVELWIRTTRDPTPVLGTTGSFVFVAIDEATWKPVEITNKNF